MFTIIEKNEITKYSQLSTWGQRRLCCGVPLGFVPLLFKLYMNTIKSGNYRPQSCNKKKFTVLFDEYVSIEQPADIPEHTADISNSFFCFNMTTLIKISINLKLKKFIWTSLCFDTTITPTPTHCSSPRAASSLMTEPDYICV